jgi:hypothetical protein
VQSSQSEALLSQQYRERHHFLQENDEWDIAVLKFQTHLDAMTSIG